MIFKLILLFYIAPLALCILFEYLCMEKGESLEEYVERGALDDFDILMLFIPIGNILYCLSFMLSFVFLFANKYIVASLWDKIKNFRK